MGEADPFIARLLKRFVEERGLRTVVAWMGAIVVDLQKPEMRDEDFR